MGVSGAAKYYEPYPVVLAEGRGGHVTDVDGNDYVDFLMGAGSSLLGHAHPALVAAVREQVGRLATVPGAHAESRRSSRGGSGS